MKRVLIQSLLFSALLCSTSCSWGKKADSPKALKTKASVKSSNAAKVEVKKGEVTPDEASAKWSVREISTQAEYDAIFTEGYPVVVKFYGNFCPPCRRMAPIFKELAADFTGKVIFVAAEVQKSGLESLARAYANRGVPSFVMFDATGKYLATRLGAVSKAELSRLIGHHCL